MKLGLMIWGIGWIGVGIVLILTLVAVPVGILFVIVGLLMISAASRDN